ncbi:hypothetical protein OESDEN_12588 [Oesophagostomum dentatum]|uniref:Potassium channel voltage dependent Kv4 C-terminal domain-containing protein n=1 Tax=Oesophagostomum dentatum TaxID=61180 RepID=A0A0B1SQT5_OESDE|nr:hypothetical protein OESDEN_12588 [Oesophagostomum dentatum]
MGILLVTVNRKHELLAKSECCLWLRIHLLILCTLQKARLARIRIVKNASGQALFNKKKAHEARMQAFEQGLLSFDALRDEDIFEIQHHHLLQCLEKATVSYEGSKLKKMNYLSIDRFSNGRFVLPPFFKIDRYTSFRTFLQSIDLLSSITDGFRELRCCQQFVERLFICY